MERRLIERDPTLRNPAPSNSQNTVFDEASDMRKSLRDAHEQKPRTKRGGRQQQQQQQLPQLLQGMQLLPVGMHEGHDGAQQMQQIQQMQQQIQQMQHSAFDLVAPMGPAWYPTSQNQDQVPLAPQPGLTFGWMPADLNK